MASAITPPASYLAARPLSTRKRGKNAPDLTEMQSSEMQTRQTRRSKDPLVISKDEALATGKRELQMVDEAPKDELPKEVRLKRPPVKPSSSKSHQKTSSRSLWDVMGHLYSRYFLLFVIVAGLGRTLWSWKNAQTSFPELSTAGKVADLEDFMKKTTKWMQSQLDQLDSKIKKEVSSVRSEMEDKISENSFRLLSEVRSLKTHAANLESSIAMFNDQDFLSKDDAVELINAAMDRRAQEGDGASISLDDVRAAARKLVQDELAIHAADGIGRMDYALESGGGNVVYHTDAYFNGLPLLSYLGISIIPGAFQRHPMANRVLQPSFGEPGQCLPLKGSNVFVDIHLRTPIYLQAITLEHVAKSVAYDIGSAPKEFQIFAWFDKSSSQDKLSKSPVGEFTYNLDKPNVQTFNIHEDAPQLVNMIRLHVLSNYGSPTHTCIYRLRVHGVEPENLAKELLST